MNITQLDYSDHDTCPICSNKFSTAGNLNKHIKNVHKEKRIVTKRLVSYAMEKFDHKCLEGCNLSFASRICLIDHLRLIHKVEIAEEKLKFSNFEEFEIWLEVEQQETNAQYIRASGWKKKPSSMVLYMNCNRSGKYHIKQENRKRKIKLDGEGSCKSGISCTSHIIVETFNKTKSCQVTYFNYHYGHVLDQRHLRIPKNTREKIAEMLLLGISFPRILDSLKSDPDSPDILNKMTRKDLNNIQQSMKIDIFYGKRDEDDAISIDMWVQECQKLNPEHSAVLYYKKRGCICGSLKESDFCLILMNTEQAMLLKNYGENLVCIDVIQGGIGFMYELSVILVANPNQKVFPVSCMIANRNDISVYEIFFTNIKRITGSISSKILMTDVYERCFEAWNKIMGPVESHFYSSWQVDCDWKSHIDKLWARSLNNNRTKRNAVYEKLRTLQNTACESEFKQLYNEFLSSSGGIVAEKNFYSYFIKTYSHPELWAKCYRVCLPSQIDELLRSMSKLLEHEFLEGRNVKRLDKAIHCLLSFTSDLLHEEENMVT